MSIFKGQLLFFRLCFSHLICVWFRFEKIVPIFTLAFTIGNTFLSWENKDLKYFLGSFLNKNKNPYIVSLVEFRQILLISIFLAKKMIYNHINVISIFLMICSYVLKKEIPKNSINYQSYDRFQKLSNFIIISDISIATAIALIDTCQELLVVS